MGPFCYPRTSPHAPTGQALLMADQQHQPQRGLRLHCACAATARWMPFTAQSWQDSWVLPSSLPALLSYSSGGNDSMKKGLSPNLVCSSRWEGLLSSFIFISTVCSALRAGTWGSSPHSHSHGIYVQSVTELHWLLQVCWQYTHPTQLLTSSHRWSAVCQHDL